MRIEGANEFLSRIAAWTDRSKNPLDPFVIRPEKDTIDLSEIGKRLSLQAKEVDITETQAKTNGDPMLSLMDKSMSSMEATLTQMKDLALAAADPNVTEAERLQMQIDMEKLRAQLREESGGMSRKLAKLSGYDEPSAGSFDLKSARAMPGDPSKFDTRSLLERARDRALKGEKWDVAEGYEEFWELQKVIVAGEDPKEITVENGEWFDLPPEIDPEKNVLLLTPEIVAGRYFVTDDKKVPTVSQILKDSGTVVITDVKSALKGLERIEAELGDIKDMRQEFAAFCETPAASVDAEFTADGILAEMAALVPETQEQEPGREEEDQNKKPRKIRTELGYMEEVEGKGMRLTRPESPKGQMFAKIQSLLDRIGGNIAEGSVTDIPANPDIDKITWTNRAQSWLEDKTEQYTKLYSASARIEEGVLETVGAILSPGDD